MDFERTRRMAQRARCLATRWPRTRPFSTPRHAVKRLRRALRPPGASCGGCGGSCGARSPAATREVRFRRLGVASSAFDISLGLWRIFVECARH